MLSLIRPSIQPLAAVVLLAACIPTVNTLPPVPTSTSPMRETVLELPDSLEIRSVDFDATLYSDVSGPSTFTTVGGRAFVKVLAVHRRTGETILLLYERIGSRATPSQIIRFQTGGPLALPGTTPSPPPSAPPSSTPPPATPAP